MTGSSSSRTSLSSSSSTSNAFASNSSPSDSSTSSAQTVHHQRSRYVVMIDAGSSGSRVHVYQYLPANSVATSGLPKFELPSKTLKIKPGLSTYEDDPKAASESLRGLIEFAVKHVPDSLWASTPIFLFATAGLRTIPAGAAEEILEEVRNSFERSVFRFERHWVRLIPGKDEGLYGWIAANYLLGNFDELPSINHSDVNSVSSSSHTIGVVEMGGASMQVSFAPSDISKIDPEELSTVSLNGRVYRIYTHSYLNYGLEQAQVLLHKSMSSSQEINNPCYPQGFTFLQQNGVGDYTACRRMLEHILDKNKNHKANCSGQRRTCSFNGIYQPAITNEQFFAIENFFYTTEFFNTHEENDFLTPLRQRGEEYCASHWSQIVAKYPKVSSDELSKYCFSTAYIDGVLRHGLGLENPQQNVRIVQRIRGTAIDWSLGAMVYAVSNGKFDSSHQCTDYSSGSANNKV